MPKWFEDRKVSTLILITIVGLIIGSYLGMLISMIPGNYVVVKEIFTFSFLPSIGYPNPVSINLGVIKFQFGLETNINIMSIIGVIVALWAYRWYK